LLDFDGQQSIMQIYLAKPGGEKKGPFTLDQINRDLAARIYRDDAYWAWHEGLPEWIPLHSVPGVNTGLAKKIGPSVPPIPVVKPPKPQEHLVQRVTSATPITETTVTTIVTQPPPGYQPAPTELIARMKAATPVGPAAPKPVAPAPVPVAPAAKEPDIFMKRPAEPAPAKEVASTTVVASKPEELMAQMQPVAEAAAKK